MKTDISRRAFCLIPPAAVLGLVLAACASGEGANAVIPGYNPEAVSHIPGLVGKDFLAEVDLEKYLANLKGSRVPFYGFAADQIQALATARSRPADFPDYVNEGSFPMPIMTDRNNASLAALGIESWEQDPNAGFIYTMPDKSVHTGKPFSSLYFGINLGRTEQLTLNTDFIIAQFLAKEYVSHAFGFRMQRDLINILREDGMTFQSSDNQAITNTSVLQKIGASIAINEMTNATSDLWRIFDVFPLLVVGNSFANAIFANEAPWQSSHGDQYLYMAASAAQKTPQIERTIDTLTNNWMRSGKPIMPEGTLQSVLKNSELISTIHSLADTMYGVR
ncbi:MAG: hypothetical protein NUV65_01970 [Candidatus Roizmanbacteria bacterium]|nr:hypothetical protein [Candidatus Roizmanbacteria bacterium]